MIDEPNVYQMGQGVYIDEVEVKELAEEYFGEDPIIDTYEAREYETEGSKKNHLFFRYELIDLETIVEEYDPEDHQETNDNINRFLEEVTGRTAKHRKEDLKNKS